MVESKDTSLVSKSPTLSAALKEGTITVKVGHGTNQRNFNIHKGLLTYHSEYFRRALQGPWKEAEDRVVTLDDVDPDIFGVFSAWLYTGQLPTNSEEWVAALNIKPPTPPAIGYARALALIKGYVLGDRLLAPVYRRQNNNTFVNSRKPVHLEPHYRIAIFAFAQLADDCAMLDSIVDYHCGDNLNISYDAWIDKMEKELPYDFLRRSLRRSQEYKVLEGKPRPHSRCWEEHTAEEKLQCGKLHFAYHERGGYGYFK